MADSNNGIPRIHDALRRVVVDARIVGLTLEKSRLGYRVAEALDKRITVARHLLFVMTCVPHSAL